MSRAELTRAELAKVRIVHNSNTCICLDKFEHVKKKLQPFKFLSSKKDKINMGVNGSEGVLRISTAYNSLYLHKSGKCFLLMKYLTSTIKFFYLSPGVGEKEQCFYLPYVPIVRGL